MKIEAMKISLSVFLIILSMMSFVVIMTNTVIEKNINKSTIRFEEDRNNCECKYSYQYYLQMITKCMMSFIFGGIVNELNFIKMGFI